MRTLLTNILLFVFCAIILALSIRGVYGNPTENNLNTPALTENGPLELSPERGRYALTYSIIENNSVKFSIPVARFATPDLGLIGNDYVSLFAPGVSFIVIPGYLIGKFFGAAQVGAYSIIAIFAIINTLLIRLIAIKLTANKTAATIASLTFLFATPAFAYAVNLYQHHITTFLILMSIYTLLCWRRVWALTAVFFLSALAITVDSPNVFFILPILIFALGKFILVENNENNIILNVKLINFLSVLGVVIPLSFFLWFNQASYGSPFMLSGNATQVKGLDEQGKPLSKDAIYEQLGLEYQQPTTTNTAKKDVVKYFKTRNLLNGFYIHFLSPDRGIIYFTPIIIFGFIGLFFLLKINPQITTLIASIIGVNIVLYSLWGDPYGGWAFGSRYLILSYALLTIFIAFFLTKTKKNIVLLFIFYLIMGYSVLVNSLGAITSSKNPPQVEAVALEKLSNKVEKYSYDRNWDFLSSNDSKSFVWRTYANKYFTAAEYYWIINTFLLVTLTSLLLKLRFEKNEN